MENFKKKTEYLDETFQEEGQNTWMEHPKKEDRIPGRKFQERQNT